MHVFEMPMTSNPSVILLFHPDAPRDLFMHCALGHEPATADEVEQWQAQAKCGSGITIAGLRTNILRLTQIITAERGPDAHLTVSEVFSLCKFLNDGVGNYHVVSQFSRLRGAIETLLASLKTEEDGEGRDAIIWAAFTQANAESLLSAFDAAVAATPGADEKTLTLGSVAEVVDRFFAAAIAMA